MGLTSGNSLISKNKLLNNSGCELFNGFETH